MGLVAIVQGILNMRRSNGSEFGVDIATSGNITALNGAVAIASPEVGGLLVSLTGTWVGTVVVEALTPDGTTWRQLTLQQLGVSVGPTGSTTVNGTYRAFNPFNGTQLRVRASAWTSGTLTAYMVLSPVAGCVQLVGNNRGTPIPVAVDTNGNIGTTTTIVSQFPAAKIRFTRAINAGVTDFRTYNVTQNLAIKQFYAGGIGPSTGVLARYVDATLEFLPSGDFEVNADVTNWPYTGVGTLAAPASRSTAQFNTGASSLFYSYTNSDFNHRHQFTYTYSTPKDMTIWRRIQAALYHVVPPGGATNVFYAIILESNGSTRQYNVANFGVSSTNPAWNTAGWRTIEGDIENPDVVTGTTFDPSAVEKVHLLHYLGNNKVSSSYWDTVRFRSSIETLFKIYHAANGTFNFPIDPVETFVNGDVIALIQKNTDTVRREYTIFAAGVSF